MWKVGDEVVIVQRGCNDLSCRVEKVHGDGSCVAGGIRWKRDGWMYGRYTGAHICRADARQSRLAYERRIEVLRDIDARLRTMTIDELRAVLASLEVSDDR